MPKLFKQICESYVGFFDTGLLDRSERVESQYTCTQPTDINQLRLKILNAINGRDAVSLKKFLTNNFIYKALNWSTTNNYRGNHHNKEWEYRYALVRPVAEVLLLEHIDVLNEMVNVISDLSLKELEQAFVYSVSSMSTYQFMVNECANSFILDRLSDAIKRLEGINNQHEGLIQLKNMRVSFSEIVDTTDKFVLLKARINLLCQINCMYNDFANDSNIKKIVVNLLMVFLGFIPNMIHFACTGDFLFFKDTKRQSIVRALERRINPEARLKDCEPDEPKQPYVDYGFDNVTDRFYEFRSIGDSLNFLY